MLNLLLMDPDPIMTVGAIIILVLVIVFLAVLFSFVPVKLWIEAMASGVRVGIGQLIGMLYINWHMIGGLQIPIPMGGGEFMLPLQGLAVLTLIPIWLYNGEKGSCFRTIQPLCYWFYPVHILVLALLAMYVF